jgi:hypothetical protein
VVSRVFGKLMYGGKSSKNMIWKIFQDNIIQNAGFINMYVFNFDLIAVTLEVNFGILVWRGIINVQTELSLVLV